MAEAQVKHENAKETNVAPESMTEEELYAWISTADKLEIHHAVNLDELCAVFMIKQAINSSAQIEVKDFEKGIRVKDLNLQTIANKKGLSLSKLIYGMIIKFKQTTKFHNPHNLLKLVDYCSRSTEKMLTKNERQKGSLINVIYAVRAALDDYNEIYAIFEYFANKVLQNPEYLNTMCDIELSITRPELAKEIYETNRGIRDVMAKYVRFIRVDKYWIVYNTSDRNLARILFMEIPNLLVYCFKSDRETGIIFRFALSKEAENKLIEYAMDKLNSEVVKKGKKIYILTNPELEADSVAQAMADFCIINKYAFK